MRWQAGPHDINLISKPRLLSRAPPYDVRSFICNHEDRDAKADTMSRQSEMPTCSGGVYLSQTLQSYASDPTAFSG